MIFDNSYIDIAIEVFQKQNDLEVVIATLKERGANQMQIVQALCRGLGMKLGEADKIVLNSPSWSDKRDFNLKIRKEFFDESNDQS